jgi:hypothetical protein
MKPARIVLRLDALFEFALAAAVLVAAAAGLDMQDAFALDEWAVVTIGAALVPVGIALLLAKPDRPTLIAVGLANTAGAALFVAYLVIWGPDMDAYGIATVAAAAIGLASLAIAELTLARNARRDAFVV